MRTTKVGSREVLPVQVLLREMRRTLREHGSMPRIEWPDARLNRAWESLVSHLARNAKISVRREILFREKTCLKK
jgi:hypothetical protein